MSTEPRTLIQALRTIVGTDHLIEGDDTTPYVTEWRAMGHPIKRRIAARARLPHLNQARLVDSAIGDREMGEWERRPGAIGRPTQHCYRCGYRPPRECG